MTFKSEYNSFHLPPWQHAHKGVRHCPSVETGVGESDDCNGVSAGTGITQSSGITTMSSALDGGAMGCGKGSSVWNTSPSNTPPSGIGTGMTCPSHSTSKTYPPGSELGA
eukprot:scaffold327395_cov66-Cyclotella_meneghiniana.AAC.1